MLSKLSKKTAVLMIMVIILELFVCVPVSSQSENVSDSDKYSVSEIIVKYKNTNSKLLKSTLKNSSQYIVKKTIDSSNIEIIDVLSTDKMSAAIELYESDPNVEYVVPNDKIKTYNYSEEPLFENQWGLGYNGVNIDQYYEYANSEDVIVGVMDTGIDINHPDLAENIIPGGWDFVNDDSTVFDSQENQHGTNVTGIIAASINNIGIAGVAPSAKILPLKVIEGETGYVSNVIEAIEYAKSNGVKIINCSWGTDNFNLALKDSIKKSDILFVCATGNSGNNTETYPAAFELNNIISVGACDFSGKIASFTNSRNTLDLYAPGVDILTTAPDSTYTSVSGTSFAAAFVTGIAALTIQTVPSLTASETAAILSECGRATNENGIRIADVAKSIRLALPIRFMKDPDSRLTKIMNSANLLITPDVADILTKRNYYNQLTDEEKDTINSFFGMSNSNMNLCFDAGIDLTESIAALLTAQKAYITASQTIALLEHYQDNSVFDSEIDNLSEIINRIKISDSEKNEIISYMQNNRTVVKIAGAYIFSKVTGYPLSQVIGTPETVLLPSNSDLTGAERETLAQIIEQYMITPTAAITYLEENNLSASDLSDKLYEWQKNNNFFVCGNSISPYAFPSLSSSFYDKYEFNTNDSWSNGNAVIDKTNGMLSYTYPLLSLAGKNGLDLNLGLRFDPEVADTVSNVKSSDLLTVSYTVTESRTYYSADLSQRLPELDCEYVYIKTDCSEVENYIAQDGMYFTDFIDTQEVRYYRNISVTAQYDMSDYQETNSSNYYDSLYSLGVGWTLTFPSIENIGNIKYLHLPDGTKYKINTDSTLEGYLLSDLSFQPDNSFHADNLSYYSFIGGLILPSDPFDEIVSAYSLSELSGIKHFFTQSGRYIGSRDLYNNSIFVYYDSDGRIERIEDSTNRKIQFNYQELETVRTVEISVSNKDSNESKSLYTITQTKNGQQKFELTGIADGSNHSTVFTYNTYDTDITLNGTIVPDSGKSIYISSVTSPTGVTTEFTYTQKLKKYGIAGTEKYFAVTAAVDKIGTAEYNAVSYQTPNLRLSQYPSGTVYPYNDISATDVCTSEKTTDNLKESTLYNNSRIPYKIQTWDTSENILKSEQEIVSFDSYSQPTEINEKSYSDAGIYSLVKTVLQWDSNGNCLSREVRSGNQDGLSVNIDEKTVTEYYSDSNIPSVKIQYSYKKEGEYYAQKTVNSILPSLRKISKSETYSCNINGNETTNDKLLYYYDYLYNSFGQLVQSKTTYSKDNQALMSSNSAVRIKDIVYDDNYGVYPVLTKSFGRYKDVDGNDIDGIKDADGNFLKDEDGNHSASQTVSSYNILGQILSSQTSDNVKKVYTYDSATHELSKVEYFDSNTKLGEESTFTDYDNNTVVTVSFNGVHTKTQYNSFGNTVKIYRQTQASVGSAVPIYELLEKNIYDSYQRLIDTYSLRTSILEGSEDLTSSGVQYTKTHNEYDEIGRIISISTTDENGDTVSSPAYYEYESGVQYGESSESYSTISKTVSSGNADNEIFKSKQFLDSHGRIRLEEYYNGATKIYTNQYTYSDFGYLSSVDGETVNSQSNENEPTENSTTVSQGVNVNNDGTSAEVTTTQITDGLGQTIQSIDGSGHITYYLYDDLGRLIKTKTPVTKIGQTVVYKEEKTYYDTNGNVCEVKEQINNIGEAEKFSSKKMKYDAFGRTVLVSVNEDDEGRCNLTQYYYEGNNTSPSRVYCGQDVPLTILGLDNIVNSEYYIDKTNNRILGIESNTELNRFLEKIASGYGTAAVLSNANSGNISTGDTVQLTINGECRNFKAVVTADVTCDGLTNLLDLVRLKKYLSGLSQFSAEQQLAARLDSDETVGGADLIVMKKILLGKKDELPNFSLPEYTVQKYQYDYLGNLVQYTDALGNSDSFEYDYYIGKPTKKTLRNGIIITLEYDAAGNLVRTVGSEDGASPVVYEYEYDLLGNVLSASNADGTIKDTYTYDNLNRLIESVSTHNGLITQVAYLYTGKDLTAMTTSRFEMLGNGTKGMGTTVAKEEYTYNETGAISDKTITAYSGNFLNEAETYKISYGYGYNADNNLIYTTIYSNGEDISCGQFSTYTYDMSDHITKISTSMDPGNTYRVTIRDESYQYSLSGNLIGKQTSILQNFDEEIEDYVTRNYFANYSYNNAGTLIEEEYGETVNNTNSLSLKKRHSYDRFGNRISEEKTDYENSPTVTNITYTYDLANRMQSRTETSSNNSSQTCYTYDLSGNLISTQETQNNGGVQSSETTVYAYDAMNRTSSITKNGTVTSFAYDENNRRISKSSGTQCTLFVWNNDQLLFETNAENYSQNNYYIFGIGGEAEGMLKNGKPYANTLDLTGNVVNSTNLTTQTETESKYDAFGNITEGQTVSSIGYSGEYLDAETGLYYLTARFYDPETGRFTQEDDWLTEGPNLYIYCRNNPVMYSDPSGHCNAYDLIYYRKKGDMATLEKLKRIIANGDCDIKYHHDPYEFDDVFVTGVDYTFMYSKMALVNYEYNLNYNISGLIYNQNYGDVAKMRYGRKTMDYNGCEIIAIYNAAYLLGKPMKIQDIAYDMEFYGSLLQGEWGTDPFRIGSYMRLKGFTVEKIDTTKIDSCTTEGTVFIISFFNSGYNPFSMIHTIALVCNGNGSFTMYNRWSNSTQNDSPVNNTDKILRGGGWIVGYKIGVA